MRLGVEVLQCGSPDKRCSHTQQGRRASVAGKRAFELLMLTVILAALALGGMPGESCEASPSIRIAPSRIEKHVKRFLFFEDRSIGPIRVTNNGTVPLRIRVTVEDLYQTQDGSAVFVTDGSYEYGAADLVVLEPAEFTVEPGMTQLVKGKIDTSSGRTGGGYCVVFFEAQSEPAQDASMATSGRIGALLYIVFPGASRVDGSIEDLQVFCKDQNRIQVRVLAHNSGNVHISPRGIVRLKTFNAEQISSGHIAPENILPAASRWLEGAVDLPSSIESGLYLLEVTLLLSDIRSAYCEAMVSVARGDSGLCEVRLDKWELAVSRAERSHTD